MKKILRHAGTAFLVALFSLGCSLVTEFDPDKLGDGGIDLYSLESNIADPVNVVLMDNGNASITLTLVEPLPDADDATLLALLTTALHLNLENSETGVTVDLIDGSQTEEEPSEPGEYRLSLNDTRDQVDVLFRNETEGGQTLREDGQYEAVVEVTPNQIFEEGSFARSVSLSSP